MSILENARQSVEYDAPVPLKVAQALTELASVAQEVVDAEYIFRHDMGAQGLLVASRRLTKAISDLAAVLEELR